MRDLLIDTNVILDVIQDDPRWCDWSLGILDQYSQTHRLIINPIIYTEISIGYQRIEELEEMLTISGIKLMPIPKEALFLSGKAFLNYRRKKGTKASTLPDFFIGAHAAVADITLATRDTKRISHYFPSVRLIKP